MKITSQLKEIQKTIEKYNKNPAEQLDSINEKINFYREIREQESKYLGKKLEKTEAEKQLEEIKKQLEKIIEYEEIKQELTKERFNKQLKNHDSNLVINHFVIVLNEYFENYPENRSIVKNVMLKSEIVKDEIKKCKKIFKEKTGRIPDVDYIEAYNKAMKKVLLLYGEDVKNEIKAENERIKAQKKAGSDFRKYLKRSIAKDIATIATIKHLKKH